MTASSRVSTLALFAGDICFFALSLWLTLFLRALSLPPHNLVINHFVAFAPLYLVWVAVFFISGLYERRQFLLARRAFSATLLSAQVANIVIAAVFFFFIPYFGIEPKTVLVIYLVVSFLLVLFWRAVVFPRLGLQKPEPALLVGSGRELEDLSAVLSASRFSPVAIVEHLRPHNALLPQEVEERIRTHAPRVIIADFEDPLVAAAFPTLYNLLLSGIRFIDSGMLYEEVFGRVPLSRLDDSYVARNISRTVHRFYDPAKRAMDIFASLVLGVISLLLYPFIMLAIRLEGPGPIFIAQERVGEGERIITLYKFRSMERNDTTLGTEASGNRVTNVGRFLRATRLDELPQLWNIFRGDLSLIGPRPELPSGVALYEHHIPYYAVRHLIKPGLSGWAQLYHENHPHHAASVDATREKLSFDLYYLKHRSLTLDAIIALKTIKKMLMKSGA